MKIGQPGSALAALNSATLHATLKLSVAWGAPTYTEAMLRRLNGEEWRQEYECTFPPLKLCECPVKFCAKRQSPLQYRGLPADLHCKRDEENRRG